jgi:hypothetical protein
VAGRTGGGRTALTGRERPRGPDFPVPSRPERAERLEIANVRGALARDDLHTLADVIQRDLAALTDHLAASFFGHAEAPARRPSRS